MKYRTLRAPDNNILDECVELYISEGWEPIGGVSVSVSEDGEYEIWAQAMIKKEK